MGDTQSTDSHRTQPLNTMLKCTLTKLMLAALFLAIAASSSSDLEPTSSDVVPEAEVLRQVIEDGAADDASYGKLHRYGNELVDVDLEASFLQAQQTVDKQDGNACRKLAEASKTEVKKAVEVAQKAVDDAAHRKTCATVGEVAVNTAQLAVDAAAKEKKKAKKKYDDAVGTKITWSFKFDQLEGPGHCGIFYDSQAYKNTAAKVAPAKEAYIKAKGATEAASKALKEAKTDYQAELEVADKKLAKTNKEAWVQAAHLICILEGKSMDQCNVPPLPALKTNLPAKVADAKCMSQCDPKSDGKHRMSYLRYKDIVYTADGISKESWRKAGGTAPGNGAQWACQATGPFGYFYEGRSMNIMAANTGGQALGLNSFAKCTKMGFMPLCHSNDEFAAAGKCLFIGKLVADNGQPWGAKKLFPGNQDSPSRYQGWYNKHFSASCAYPKASDGRILCNSYMTTAKTQYNTKVGGWNGHNLAVLCASPQYGADAKKKKD